MYRWYATPWEILRQLPDLARHLKEGITIEKLEAQSRAMSDYGGGGGDAKGQTKAINGIQQRRIA